MGILQRGDIGLWNTSRKIIFPEDLSCAREICERLTSAVVRLRNAAPSPRGTGLAAPQLGELVQITCIMKPGDKEPQCFINPTIMESSFWQTIDYEGCFSFLDVRGRVMRPDWITISYDDLTGAPHTETLKGGFCRLMEHEIDHLDGILYVDKMRGGERPIRVDEYLRRRAEGTLALPEHVEL